jgi:hypothetical protein
MPLDYLRTQGISAQGFPFLRPGSLEKEFTDKLDCTPRLRI